MRQRDRLGVDVIRTLTGPQVTSVSAHHPGARDASVTVRLAGVSVRMWDAATSARVVRVFDQLTREVLARLPREINRLGIHPAMGPREPEVVICAVAASTAAGRVQHLNRDVAAVVRIGRVVLDLRDREAFGAASSVFREAHSVANAAFARIMIPAQRSAIETASRAFASHRARRTPSSRASRTGRAWPPTAAPGQARSHSGERWLG